MWIRPSLSPMVSTCSDPTLELGRVKHFLDLEGWAELVFKKQNFLFMVWDLDCWTTEPKWPFLKTVGLHGSEETCFRKLVSYSRCSIKKRKDKKKQRKVLGFFGRASAPRSPRLLGWHRTFHVHLSFCFLRGQHVRQASSLVTKFLFRS